MRTGTVEISGRLVLMVGFLNRRTGEWESPREAADENVVRLLIEGLPNADTCGFRFFTRVQAVADAPGGEVEAHSSPVEIGPRHFIGCLVTRDCVLQALRNGAVDLNSVARLFRDARAVEGGRIVRDHVRCYHVANPCDVVVGLDGNLVTEVLGSEEGWTPDIELRGGEFVVEFLDDVVVARALATDPADVAAVKLCPINPPSTMHNHIVAQCRRAGIEFSDGNGTVYIPKDRELCIQLSSECILRLAWDGDALTVDLTRA